ncbi:replication initiation protein, partial [Clostridium acetobutylicum]
MVQPTDEEFKPYKFKINDFMILLGVDTKTKYTKIPKITKELMKKVFEIQEGDILIQTAWLSGAKYKKGTGYVELTFSPYLKPYMLKLNNMFTKYKLANILNMKSKYSPRIYEILKCNEFKKQGYIEIDIEDLRKLLKAEDIYPMYADFKRKIINQTQKELNKLSDIKFEFEEIKTGRKVTAIRFYINSNIKAKDETSVTKLDTEEPERLEDSDKYIKEIKNIIANHKITSLEARKIYHSSKGNLKQIHKVYNYFKNRKLDNFVGTMISMVKPGVFQEPKANIQTDDFNNYSQRQYNFNDLEKGLLGWQNSKE